MPSLIVFPTYIAGSQCEVQRVPEAAAAYLLGENSSRLQDVVGGALPALARLARRAAAYSVVHADVNAAAQEVADLLRAS